jgi:hypothetical protein
MTAPGATGIAASVVLSDLFSGPRTVARVCGVSGPACYVDADGWIVVIEGPDGAGLPDAVRVADPARPPLRLTVGDEVVIGRGALTAGGRDLPVQRWWDPVVRIGSSRLDAAGVAVVSAMLRSAARSVDPGAMSRPDTTDLTEALRRRDAAGLAVATRALLGRGAGLTPAGDDVLAGTLATLRVLGPSCSPAVAGDAEAMADVIAGAVTGVAHERTTALSAQLLRHADRGAVALPVADVLRAVAGRGELVGAAARLAGMGHTSGGDVLMGIALAVDTMLSKAQGAVTHDQR